MSWNWYWQGNPAMVCFSADLYGLGGTLDAVQNSTIVCPLLHCDTHITPSLLPRRVADKEITQPVTLLGLFVCFPRVLLS